LKFDAEKRPKLVHRQDRDTTGCLVLARHPRAAAFLADAFRDRATDKNNWANVVGSPPPKVG
jgi:23S rRNA pseudouridine955/2504/2580 synthase